MKPMSTGTRTVAASEAEDTFDWVTTNQSFMVGRQTTITPSFCFAEEEVWDGADGVLECMPLEERSSNLRLGATPIATPPEGLLYVLKDSRGGEEILWERTLKDEA